MENQLALTRQDIIDIANVMVCQEMYYVKNKPIKYIVNRTGLPENVVMQYLNVNLDAEQRKEHIIRYISTRCFDIVQTVGDIISDLSSEVRNNDYETISERNNTIKTLTGLVSSYSSILDLVRRTNLGDVGNGAVLFQLNIIQEKQSAPQQA